MKGKPFLLVLVFLLGAAILSQLSVPGYTRIILRDAGTGRTILSAVLSDGEEIVMTWKNSLFGLRVTEVFHARKGWLVLTAVTFADPQGPAPPAVRPSDVDDLYHTGGAFTATGLDKSFERITHRVGEIGDPRVRVRGREIAFKQEVGFGGRVLLIASGAKLYHIMLERGAS
jgi:hypothetical protein